MTDSEYLSEILAKREHCIEGPMEDYVLTSQEVLDEVPWLVSEVKRLQESIAAFEKMLKLQKSGSGREGEMRG